jgi:Rrf2 family protein
MFNRTCQHAMRLLLHLSTLRPGERSSAAKAAKATGIPSSHASKIVSRLSQEGLVAARRGPRGGIMLGRAAAEISLMDVVQALGEKGIVAECFLGLPECGDAVACPVHAVWKDVKHRMGSALLTRTLEDFASISLVPPRARAGRR